MPISRVSKIVYYSFVILFAFLLSIVVSVYGYYYASQYSKYRVWASLSEREIGGWECTDDIFYYDNDGNFVENHFGHQVDYSGNRLETYVGPGPIFGFSYPDKIPGVDWKECSIPEKVPSSFAHKGKQIYPLIYTIKSHFDEIRYGESILVEITSTLKRNFNEEDMTADNNYVLLHIYDEENITCERLLLYQTGFHMQPTEGEKIYSPIVFNRSNSSVWILTPKEYAAGNQKIAVVAEIKDKQGEVYRIHFCNMWLTVVKEYGLNPLIVALVSAIGSFLIGLFTLIKLVPESIIALRKIFKKG